MYRNNKLIILVFVLIIFSLSYVYFTTSLNEEDLTGEAWQSRLRRARTTISSPTTTIYKCVDYDKTDINNLDDPSFYTLSSVKYTYKRWWKTKTREYNDYCRGNYLYERYCSNNRARVKKVLCSKGCENGACKKEKVKCADSDNGKDYYKKGTITITYENGYERTETDFCNKDGTLREWYCGRSGDPAGLLRSENYVRCPEDYVCKDGACVKEEEGIEHNLKYGEDKNIEGIKIKLIGVSPTTSSISLLINGKFNEFEKEEMKRIFIGTKLLKITNLESFFPGNLKESWAKIKIVSPKEIKMLIAEFVYKNEPKKDFYYEFYCNTEDCRFRTPDQDKQDFINWCGPNCIIYKKPLFTIFNEPKEITQIYPVNKNTPKYSYYSIHKLKDFYEDEAKRYGTEMNINLETKGPYILSEKPPQRLRDEPPDKLEQFFDNEAQKNNIDISKYDVIHYVYFTSEHYMVSTISGKKTFNQAFIHFDEFFNNIHTITHETGHVFGQVDTYKPGTWICQYPIGYPEPNKSPLYPQNFACLMCKSIMLYEHQSRAPYDFNELTICDETAEVFGWK